MTGIAIAVEHGVAVQVVETAPVLSIHDGDIRAGSKVAVASATIGRIVIYGELRISGNKRRNQQNADTENGVTEG